MVKVFAYSIPNIHVKIHSEYLTQTKYDDWYSFLLINYGLQWEKNAYVFNTEEQYNHFLISFG